MRLAAAGRVRFESTEDYCVGDPFRGWVGSAWIEWMGALLMLGSRGEGCAVYDAMEARKCGRLRVGWVRMVTT